MNIKMYYVGASTCVIEINNTIKIAIDPALSPQNHHIKFSSFKSIRLKGPNYTDSIFKDIHIWLITHSHEDHLDLFGAKFISNESIILCDAKSKSSRLLNDKKLNSLGWGDSYNYVDNAYAVNITAIPAYHGNSLITRTIIGKVNGYLLEITLGSQSKTLYFTGDTVFHKKILPFLPSNIDLMVANLGNVRSKKLGGPLTMNLDMLEYFIKALSPKKIIPIHIDDFSHYETSINDIKRNDVAIFPKGKWMSI